MLYNWTEAAFRGLSLVWFVFYIIAMDYPRREYESVLESSEIAGIEEEREFAYGRSGED